MSFDLHETKVNNVTATNAAAKSEMESEEHVRDQQREYLVEAEYLINVKVI